MYAVTKIFELKSINGSILSGWAAPENGPRCACLEFYADNVLVAAARADGHDPDAGNAGLRDGWCKFEIRLATSHFVLADTLSMRCAAGGHELHQLSVADIQLTSAGQPVVNSVEDILGANLETRHVDPLAFAPIVQRLARKLGLDEFVSFAYQLTLQRRADPGGLATYRQMAKTDPMTVVDRLMKSEEFKNKKLRGLPNPFSHDFPQLPLFAQ